MIYNIERVVSIRTVADRAACALLLCIFSVIANAGEPQSRRDPVAIRGEHLAKIICSSCHVVAPDQEFPPLLREPAPEFSNIANRAGVTEQSLRRFITTTHWDESTLPMTMPSLELNAEQAHAVSRYILSLRTSDQSGERR